MITHDHFLASNLGIVPDKIKIDVEGAEEAVIEGAWHTISRCMPSIIIEYSESTSLYAGYTREVIIEKFRLTGYSIFGIPENPNDFRLIKEKDFHNERISNLIILSTHIQL